MNWLEAWLCGLGMPAPFSNLLSEIVAPVASSRQSIFSWRPLSDLARQGTSFVWMRISVRLGAPFGIAGPFEGLMRFSGNNLGARIVALRTPLLTAGAACTILVP